MFEFDICLDCVWQFPQRKEKFREKELKSEALSNRQRSRLITNGDNWFRRKRMSLLFC